MEAGNTNRGQTIQDYLTGVSIMVLVLTGVFTFVPGVFVTLESGIGSGEYSHADQFAVEILENTSVPGAETTVNRSALLGPPDGSDRGVFNDSDRYRDLEERAGIEQPGAHRGIQTNVSLLKPSGYSVEQYGTAGDRYVPDQYASAQTVRLVTFAQNDTCDPACRLIVRVWKNT